MRPKLFIAFFVASALNCLLLSVMWAQSTPQAINGPHCINSGPVALDPDYCGCTWGGVYYRGEPIIHAPVALSFNAQSLITTTNQYLGREIFPFYDLSGTVMGAKLNDIMTVTTQVAGQTASRTFRARPDGERAQQVPLVIPEQGIWAPWPATGYTRTLATQGNVIWAGGPAGLLAIHVTDHVTSTQPLSWTNPAVVALAVAPNGHVWAAGPQNLAEFDGATWQNRPLPFSVNLRALAIDPVTGALWAAGWKDENNPGALAIYTGSWQTVNAVAKVFTSLVVDSNGDLWAGTWGDGLYRHEHSAAEINSGWTHYNMDHGLASDEIYALAADSKQVWVATNSYRNSSGQPVGGVSRYTLANHTWRTFTLADGLPADPVEPTLTAPIYTVSSGADGSVWIGALSRLAGENANAIYFLATPDSWAKEATFANSRINALAVADKTVLAATSTNLEKLDRSISPGAPPTVIINTPATTITLDSSLVLNASASDQDENGGRILGWAWTSNRVGPLCTTDSRCVVPGQLLGEGLHQITLRVQDDEGVWSQPAAVQVNVTQPKPPDQKVFLPLVTR